MKRNRGFTLVELLVVIGIIALLISILLPALGKARQQATLIACSAKMRDFGNAITMYTMDNKQFFPGPCLGQVRAGYTAGENLLSNYLWRYLRLPAPNANPQIMKALLCPGYQASNPGLVLDAELMTYSMQFWDPYPWFGYASGKASTVYFTIYSKLYPGKVGTGTYNGMVLPMKIGQVWKGAEMPVMSDVDNAQKVYFGGGWTPADGSLYTSISKIPNHGGKPEQKLGAREDEDANANYTLVITDVLAATNPPRNWLFMDGHVATVRASQGLTMPRHN